MSASRRSVLVTGAAGFVGRFMVEALKDDYAVVGLGRDPRPDWLSPEIDWYQGDLLRAESLQALPVQWHAVVHLAGNAVPGTFDSTDDALRNVTMTLALLEHVGATRFLAASSALVYAPGVDQHGEDERVRPQGLYGLSKYLCEQTARVYSNRHDICIARPFNHIGPGMRPDLAIPSIIRRVLKARESQGPIEMLGKDSIRDIIDVRDVVSAYKALIEIDSLDHDVYNVCTGVPTSIGVVIRTALCIAGLEREIVFAEQALSRDDTSRVVGDPSRLMADTGWSPNYSLEQSLRVMLTSAGLHGGAGGA